MIFREVYFGPQPLKSGNPKNTTWILEKVLAGLNLQQRAEEQVSQTPTTVDLVS